MTPSALKRLSALLLLLAAQMLLVPPLRAQDGPVQGAQKPSTKIANDKFGIRMLFPTIKSGREWFASWEKKRAVGPYKLDPHDPLFKNSEKILEIENGIASIPAGQTRFFILTPKDKAEKYTAAMWRNVEMTAYVKCGVPTGAPAGQALTLSARSGERHNGDVPCEGTSYHGSLRFDGQCGFKKEIWHTGGYTNLQPDPAPTPWSHVPQHEWLGLKFVCRNCNSDKNVQLQLYLDLHERNDWKPITSYTDQGGWKGKRVHCDRPQDFILTDAYPAVYFRTDSVPVEVKKFSVREVEPLK